MLMLGCFCWGVHIEVSVLGCSGWDVPFGILVLGCSFWGANQSAHIGMLMLGCSHWGACAGVLILKVLRLRYQFWGAHVVVLMLRGGQHMLVLGCSYWRCLHWSAHSGAFTLGCSRWGGTPGSAAFPEPLSPSERPNRLGVLLGQPRVHRSAHAAEPPSKSIFEQRRAAGPDAALAPRRGAQLPRNPGCSPAAPVLLIVF